jgi:ribosomal protein S18 acetylase RimI-like enzyme
VTIRPVMPADVPAVVAMVHDLAAYERAPDACTLTREQLHEALFGRAAALFGHVAVADTGDLAGFALWFLNFSTWRGRHGIYLEDFYIRPEARGSGHGRAMLAELAAICAERGYARLDLAVLHWNTPAREVYHALGAEPLDEWVPYRLEGDALLKLAESASGLRPQSADPAGRDGRPSGVGSPFRLPSS